MKDFINWFFDHFRFRYIFTPFGTSNIVYRKVGTIGFQDVYVFGLRIARIQKTTPWG